MAKELILLTVTEAARVLDVPRSELARLLELGKIKPDAKAYTSRASLFNSTRLELLARALRKNFSVTYKNL